ncbi:GlyB [Xanthomonas phaseoli pv. phaseoli]|uniref:GlyB n=1 Tax=Xanthomonas campestris pv. phaseoli TaxID=317013 RepID=A0AB38DX94_XANCH|nr:GlyB [Xanthomonas phaseoli pv. phaseoli]SON80351.1 GlyB [Xanthomonas phaseoli pv. phaseoli]SON83565.1 GlyB [Xanthomonas phaseoli pv. phaseoli]
MPSRALIFLLLAASSMRAHAQNDAPPTWTIRAAISGNQLVGEWELSKITSQDELLQRAASAQIGIARGASFQIQVTLVNPVGVEVDVTGSSKLIYRPKACLNVTPSGMATLPSIPSSPGTCQPGDPLPITIIYFDKTAGVAAANMYAMKIN